MSDDLQRHFYWLPAGQQMERLLAPLQPMAFLGLVNIDDMEAPEQIWVESLVLNRLFNWYTLAVQLKLRRIFKMDAY